VAAGEPLPLSQDEIRIEGHAIEARVCAEDPARGFMPSAGRLSLLQWPQGEGVRVDAGFGTGDVVPDSYDSLLGKVIAWGPDRAEAAARLAGALERTLTAGVHTNEHWLAGVVRSPRFREVRHDIAFLESDAASLATSEAAPAATLVLGALAAQPQPPLPAGGAASPWARADAFTPNLPARLRLQLTVGRASHVVELEYRRGVPAFAVIDGAAPLPLDEVAVSAREVAARLGASREVARIFRDGAQLHLWFGAVHYELRIEDPREREFASSAATGGLTSPLPGAVVSVAVHPGQVVEAGAALMVIEAMKMEHTITAPFAGTVGAIHFAPGARVPEGATLLELERPAGA
jgi:3-methylcrotonyl-CoA carboxylase alpha subunit